MLEHNRIRYWLNRSIAALFSSPSAQEFLRPDLEEVLSEGNDADGKRITNLGEAEDDQDAVPLSQAKSLINSAVTGLWDDRGNYDPTDTSLYPETGGSGEGGAIGKGDIWTVSANGIINDHDVRIGDTVRALEDNPDDDDDSGWAIAQDSVGIDELGDGHGIIVDDSNPQRPIIKGEEGEEIAPNITEWVRGDGWTEDNEKMRFEGGVAGKVVQLNLVDAGSGYSVNNELFLNAGLANARIVVDTVDTGGEILEYHLIEPGSGYSAQQAVETTGGDGNGATFDISVSHVGLYLPGGLERGGKYLVVVSMEGEEGNIAYGLGGGDAEQPNLLTGAQGYQWHWYPGGYFLSELVGDIVFWFLPNEDFVGNIVSVSIKRINDIEITPKPNWLDIYDSYDNRLMRKVFKITQDSSDAPTNNGFGPATNNDGGDEPDWSRNAEGVYLSIKAGWLTGNVWISPQYTIIPGVGSVKISQVDIDTLKVETFSDALSAVPADSILVDFCFEILVYND